MLVLRHDIAKEKTTKPNTSDWNDCALADIGFYYRDDNFDADRFQTAGAALGDVWQGHGRALSVGSA